MSKNKHQKSQLPPAVPNAATAAAVVNKVHDPIPALSALYQGEKTDASYLNNTAMVMVGLALAYLLGAIQWVDKLQVAPNARLSLVLLPVPLWLVLAYQSLVTLTTMSHGLSVKIIENALFASADLRVSRDLVGSAAGDKIMDINKAKPVHIITTLLVYGGIFLSVLVFTIIALVSAHNVIAPDVILPNARVVLVAIVSYSILFIIIAGSWKVGLRMIKQGHNETKDTDVTRFGPNAG
jgi:hypothetical protein